MNCLYFRIRTKNYLKYIYCTYLKKKVQISKCRNCKYKKYKPIKELKKKSKKQKKLEDKRFSIMTDDFSVCYICGKKKKQDLHEAIGGSNRLKSIEWGLVIPVCRECHSEVDINQKLKRKIQQESQLIFENKYSHELFMTEFKRNYLDGGI